MAMTAIRDDVISRHTPMLRRYFQAAILGLRVSGQNARDHKPSNNGRATETLCVPKGPV